jgi:dihydroxyacetone kinase-like protein
VHVITKDEILAWLHCYRQVLAENKDYLTQLDSAIGDADHGINMDRGFAAVEKKLPTVEDKDIGTILKTTGMALVGTVGGAGGPLYGTFFMRAGMALNGKDELSAEDMVKAFEAAIEGVKMRGKATTGEKTMLDALVPALEAMKAVVDQGGSIHDALVAAAQAAEEGMKATIPMLATKGRASYLGERSIGHQDPGATSSYLMMKCAAETIRG